MGMTFNADTAVLEGAVYEESIVPLRDYLQERSPEGVVFDLRGCSDIHLGVAQLMLAYARVYEAEFLLPSESRVFAKIFEGIRGEND